MRHHVRNAMAAFLFAVLLTGVDIGTKWYVLTVIMDPPKRIPILPFFDFVLVYNRGVSFGLLGGLGVWGPLILSGLAIVIIGVFGFWLWRTRHRGKMYIFAAVIGGTLGNVVDRMHDGAVTDFIDLYVGSYHWPVFNVADIFITVGVVCLLAFTMKTQSSKSNQEEDQSPKSKPRGSQLDTGQ